MQGWSDKVGGKGSRCGCNSGTDVRVWAVLGVGKEEIRWSCDPRDGGDVGECGVGFWAEVEKINALVCAGSLFESHHF
jgi:hypothetical protein